jgi:choline kinase
MKALILAAEGSSLAQSRRLPTCLQPVAGASCLLEQQIRKVNLLGLDDSDITVVIGTQGSWSTESAARQIEGFKSINFVYNDSNFSTTSEASFYKALPIIKSGRSADGVLCINSDAIIDLRHLESIIDSQSNSSLLIRKPASVNQPGIRLLMASNNKICLAQDETTLQYPWYIYAGVCYLSPVDLNSLVDSEPRLGTGGLIYTADEVVGLESFNWTDYDLLVSYKTSSSTSRDLVGGSFAALKRSHLVRKQAVNMGCEKLLQEIQWLERLPDHLAPYFPPVVDSLKTDNLVWYDMPWYDLPSLRKNILTGVFSPDKTWEIMKGVLDFMFGEVYTITSNDDGGIDWLVSKHLVRVRDRITETWQSSPDLRPLIAPETLIINGKEYRNIPSCIELLSAKISLLKSLAPRCLRMIHGDLHFQNILVGPAGNDRGFILADPRGELNGSDLFYDMGKLWHSFNGLYDLIHTDLFTFDQVDSGNQASFNYKFSNKGILKTYSQIKALAHLILDEYPLIQQDSGWLMKTLFAEAMHFSSVMAFHLNLSQDNQRAKVLYLQGVKLFNEFLSVSDALQYPNDLSVVKQLNLQAWRSSLIH